MEGNEERQEEELHASDWKMSGTTREAATKAGPHHCSDHCKTQGSEYFSEIRWFFIRTRSKLYIGPIQTALEELPREDTHESLSTTGQHHTGQRDADG